MSYILDALRKSEAERGASVPAAALPAPEGILRRTGFRVAAGALGSVIVLVGIAIVWQSAHRAPAPAAPPVAASPAPAPTSPARPLAPAPSVPASPPARDLAAEARAPSAPVAAPVATIPNESIASEAPRAVPFLRQMPETFRAQLPPLAVNIHVFSDDPAQCVLYINNRQYRPGEQVAPGVRLVAIVEDGAVLSYNGRRFKLPRPQ